MKEFPIIQKLGGRSEARRLLGEHLGRDLHRNTIHTWVVRGNIPTDKVVALMEIAQGRDISLSAGDLRLKVSEEVVA